jgi:hypothetical protein
MSVDEAISYLRRQARDVSESIYYGYVLDDEQRLLGVVSFRELFACDPAKRLRDVMHTDLVTVREEQDQESVSRLFNQHRFIAIPVVDGEDRMKGIVTVDDIVDVVREEATEDIQKIGGTQAPRRAVSADLAAEHGEEARRLARRPVRQRDADDDGDEPVRGGDLARGRARRVRAAHHLGRRQLGVAGVDARDPRDGTRARCGRATAGASCGASSRRGCSWGAVLGCDRVSAASRCGSSSSTRTGRITCSWRPPLPAASWVS